MFFSRACSAVVVSLVMAGGARAATDTVPQANPTAAAAKVAPASRCMRLPLSDIAVGRSDTIAQAQMRLGEYAQAEAKRRGWQATLVKSAETVSCEDYLYLPLIGQEYKCLVTATFCTK